MIYTPSERRQFEDTIRRFTAMYGMVLQRMSDTFRDKGRTRDTDTPIHHRMSPGEMLAIIQAKGRRVDSLFEAPDWVDNDVTRAKVVEEAVDMANYAVYITAFCYLIDDEKAVGEFMDTLREHQREMTDEEYGEHLVRMQQVAREMQESLQAADSVLPAKMGIRGGKEVILRFEDGDISLGEHEGEDLEAIRGFIKALGQEG